MFKCSEESLGKEHPDKPTSTNNLAEILRNQSEYEQVGRDASTSVRAAVETVLGKEHPDTLTSMNYLAFVPSHQGKYNQAARAARDGARQGAS
jgi:cytochrome c-type biogenesis protein CcmH/NrfG